MHSSSSTTRIQRPCKGEAFCATASRWRVADPGERAAVPRSSPAGVLGGPDANVQDPALALPANGLLGVGDQVQEDLNHLIGIAHYSRDVQRRHVIHNDVVGA